MRHRHTPRGLLLPALLLALGGFVLDGAAQDGGILYEGPTLYEWEDENGIVRYTPDRKRIPRNRRSSLRLVEPGAWTVAPPEPPHVAAPAEGMGIGAGLPAVGGVGDPFNDPGTARAIEKTDLSAPEPAAAAIPTTAPAMGTTSALPAVGANVSTAARAPDPAAEERARREARDALAQIEARIAELELAISHDEETLKDMISAPEGDGGVSPELREIARRLPELHQELGDLRKQRTQAQER